jgi:fucose permease
MIIKNDQNKTSVFQFPHLMIGVLSLFLYVGVEVIAGDSIILYGASQGIALSTAKFFTSFTLSGMLIGYLIGIIAIPRFLSQEKALQISAILGIIFCLLALATNGKISLTFIALLGLANALIYPSIWPLALNGLGSFTKIGSSLLIMAIGGGAILPLIYGRIADHFSPHQAYWMVIPCYLVILFYAVRGHKLVSK